MKKNIFKKVVTLGLIASLSFSMLAACAKKPSTDTSTPNTGKVDEVKPTEAPTATPEPVIQKSEGEMLAEQYSGFVETPTNLNGRKIRVLTTAITRYTHNENKDLTSNETLEIISAIESIERDYNCTIEFEQLKGKDMVEALVTAKSAGDVYCDILEFGCSDTYLEQIYAGDLVMPLESEQVKDIIKLDTNPWLPASVFGEMFGHKYGVHFKTNNTGDLLRGVVLFNKDLVEKYNLGDMYELVNTKQWTFDKFQELCASIASQSDGTVYPLLYGNEGIYLPMLIFANGGTVAEYVDGKYVFTGLQDKTLEALNFAVDLKTKGFYHPKSDVKKEDETTFANGEVVFFFGIYNSLKKYTQGTIAMEDNVGLIPAPLGPNGSGEYNAVSYTEAMFHVVNNVEKPEEVAAVLVALANRTGKRDMLETELVNTLQDEESAAMLDLMYNNMVLDLSRSISTSRSPLVGANKSIMALEKTPKQAYEEVEPIVDAAFNALVLSE